jgi:hypothetical protein
MLAWLRTAFATPTVLTVLIVAGFLFPDGRPIAPRWWGGVALTVLSGSLLSMSLALNPEGLVAYPSLPNPVVASRDLGPFVRVALLGAVLGLVMAMALKNENDVLTAELRNDLNEVRRQIKAAER